VYNNNTNYYLHGSKSESSKVPVKMGVSKIKAKKQRCYRSDRADAEAQANADGMPVVVNKDVDDLEAPVTAIEVQAKQINQMCQSAVTTDSE
jgi:hypothetical protein